MSVNKYNAMWTRFLDHDDDPLTVDETKELLRFLDESEERMRLFSDDEVIHGLLRAVANRTNQEQFVQRCLTEFEQQTRAPETEVRIQTSSPSRRRLASHSPQQRARRRLVTSVVLTAASILVVVCLTLIVRNWDTDDQITEQPQGRPQPESSVPTNEIDDAADTDDVGSESLPSLKKIEPSVVQGPETQSEQESKRDFSFEFPLKREQITQRTPNKNLRDGAFATVVFERGAEWTMPLQENGRVANQTLTLESGLAALELDNQVRVQLSAPAEIALESLDRIRLVRGKVRIAIPNSLGDFVVVGRDSELKSTGLLDLYVSIDESATELVLTAGQLQLQRNSASLEIPALLLTSTGLNHAYLNATKINSSIPAMVVAHGPTRYFGQMAFPSGMRQWDSPDDFEQALTKSYQNQETIDRVSADERLELFERIKRFNVLFRQRGDFNNAPGFQSESQRQFSFQGEITIDGERVDFSSPSEFDKFFRQSSGN